ncbi:helix-turn-helix domain-containing protein [Vallitalea pronyensis]|uniref:Helix-turn-helix domain-containing protein n=1 Tax=Vallitalea pronyensis TaxID=1348613 RepID=A0A8J8MPT8_9FIRM|nr:response regulator transcription factor [Vallitalea pronyensis]QUI25341.1 helix-turn-helix domain-containing protein [Vallitalea pronyensis]
MKKNDLLLKYFLKTFMSYFIAVIIPVVIFCTIYIRSTIPTINEEQLEIYTKSVEADAKRISDTVGKINSYLLLLNASKELQEIESSSYENVLYSYSWLMDNLILFKRNNEIIDRAGVYVANSGKLITSDSRIEQLDDVMEKELIVDFVEKGYRWHFYNREPKIYLATVLPRMNYDDDIIVIFEFDPNRMLESEDSENLMLLYENGQVLFAGNETMVTADIDQSYVTSGEEIGIRDEKQYIIAYKTAEPYKITILRTYGNESLKSILRNSIYFALSIILILMVVSIGMAYVLAKQQVKPIVKISEKLYKAETVVNDEFSLKGSIFDKIEASFRRLQSENKDYIHKLVENRNIVKEQLLRELLWGRVNHKDKIADYLKSVDVIHEDKSKDYILINFRIAENIPSDAPIEASEIAVIVKSSIEKHLFSQLEVVGGVIIEMKQIVFLINGQSGIRDIELEEKISNIVKEIGKVIMEQNHIYIRTIVSYPMDEVRELNSVFMQIRRLLSGTDIKNDSIRFLRKELDEDDTYIEYYKTNLVQNIQRGDIFSAQNLLKEIFNLDQRICLGKRKTNYILMMLNSIITTLMENNNLLEEHCLSVMDIIFDNEIGFTEKCDKISNAVVAMTTKCMESTLRNDHNAYVYNAVEYINKNYEQNIDLTQIADYIGINTSYFSRVFKSDMNMTPLQYITMVRINKAKELLAGSNDSIKEIAEQVGYLDSRSFIRFFKKMDNCTPGQYRKNLIKNKGV